MHSVQCNVYGVMGTIINSIPCKKHYNKRVQRAKGETEGKAKKDKMSRKNG